MIYLYMYIYVCVWERGGSREERWAVYLLPSAHQLSLPLLFL